ncbi:serine kinase/phosphatase [Pseudomonas sp. SDO524_S393]
MTESRRPYGAAQPPAIDDNEDRMGSVRELDFDKETPTAQRGDDLTPETLIKEDGARDAAEEGNDNPADYDLSIVDEDDIGGGNGLDEAELADIDPVDGNR